MSRLPFPARITTFTVVGAGAGFVAAMEASREWGGGEVVWELMALGGPLGVSLGGTTALGTWAVINVIMYARRPTSRGAPIVAVLFGTAVCAALGHDLAQDSSQHALTVFLAWLGLTGSTIEVLCIRAARTRSSAFRAPPRRR